MKQTVNSYQFHRAFETTRPENFSYDGLNALYEYIEEYEESTGEEMELDVIALCCEYDEYENIAEYNENYQTEHESRDDIDETDMIPVGDEGFIIKIY